MVDTKFTDLEYPLIEFHIDNRIDDNQIEIFKANCLRGLEDLNIFNIALDFKTVESLERFMGSFTDGLTEKVNGLLRFNIDLLSHFNSLDIELIAGYADVIIEIGPDQLQDYDKMRELDKCKIKPILRITYICDAENTAQLYKTLMFLEEVNKIKYIIVNPDYRTPWDFKSFHELIDFNRDNKREHRAFFDRGSLPASIMRAHPCNAYILSCASCHYGKKDIPRSFVIKGDGGIYPEGLDEEFAEFYVGNIFEKDLANLLSDYWLGENHHAFKEACERVYHTYVLDFPFGLMPWRQFFYQEAQGVIAELRQHKEIAVQRGE